jgi:hypothetical protein
MIKSELTQRISSQNPHLYQRDIEKIVSTILDEIVEALRRGDRVELLGFGAFSAKPEEHVKGAIPVPVLSSQSQRELFPSSRQERRCVRGLIGKPCHQTDSTPALTNKGGGDPSLGSAFKCKEILTNHRSRYCRST